MRWLSCLASSVRRVFCSTRTSSCAVCSAARILPLRGGRRERLPVLRVGHGVGLVAVGLSRLREQDQRRGVRGLQAERQVEQDEGIEVELDDADGVQRDPGRDDERLRARERSASRRTGRTPPPSTRASRRRRPIPGGGGEGGTGSDARDARGARDGKGSARCSCVLQHCEVCVAASRADGRSVASLPLRGRRGERAVAAADSAPRARDCPAGERIRLGRRARQPIRSAQVVEIREGALGLDRVGALADAVEIAADRRLFGQARRGVREDDPDARAAAEPIELAQVLAGLSAVASADDALRPDRCRRAGRRSAPPARLRRRRRARRRAAGARRARRGRCASPRGGRPAGAGR